MIIAHDEDAAASIINSLNSINDQFDTNSVSSQKDLEQNLSGWSGEASKSMGESNNTTFNNINDCSDVWKGMASYIAEYNKGIEEIEDFLASQKI